MSAASIIPLAVAVALLTGAYLLWWLDRFRWEPLGRFLVTALLAAVVSMGVFATASRLAGSGAASSLSAEEVGGATARSVGGQELWDRARAAEILGLHLGVLAVLLLLSRRGVLEGPLDGAVYGLAAASGVAAETGVRLVLMASPAGPWVGAFGALLGACAIAVLGACVGRGVLAVRIGPLLGWSVLGLAASVTVQYLGELAWRAVGLGRFPWRWVELAGPATALLALLGALIAVLWVERRILARQLAEEVGFGVMPAWAADTISCYRKRVRGDWWGRGDERRALVSLVVSLAHKKEQLGFLPEKFRSLYGIEVGRLRQRARVVLADASGEQGELSQ